MLNNIYFYVKINIYSKNLPSGAPVPKDHSWLHNQTVSDRHRKLKVKITALKL